mmetsp:Transcript_31968/g.62893  ORF Transcript_31968/g.62893 Transcript_31968/m.62893 type:complete len:366 (+) Transcript_31968:30-1127(+)
MKHVCLTLALPWALFAVGVHEALARQGSTGTSLRRQTTADIRPLWTFWASENKPDFVQLCVQSLSRQAGPGWEMHIVTPASVGQYVSAEDLPSAFSRLEPSFQADAVRLALLRRHGGAWLDATTIVLRGLSDWINPEFDKGMRFVGFYIQHFTKASGPPLVASWAIAVPDAENDIVVAWHKAYLQVWHNRTNSDGITSDPFFAGADFCCVDPLMWDYLHIELILLTLLRRNEALLESFQDSSTFLRAEDTAYSIQATLGLSWMATNMCGPVNTPFASLADGLQETLKATPIVKLRHQDRRWLMEMPAQTLLAQPGSVMSTLFLRGTKAENATVALASLRAGARPLAKSGGDEAASCEGGTAADFP